MPLFARFFDLTFVQMGNFWYFLFPLVVALIVVILDHHCQKKGQAYTDRLVLTLAFINLGLHILKQFFPRYRAEWPDGLADSLFPNLCAALITLSPFILLFGRPSWKDYMYYLGTISGVAAILVPTGAMRYEDFPGGFSSMEYVIEVARFYFCHAVLVIVGYLMVARGSHKLSYKRIKWIPLVFAFFFVLVGLHATIWGPLVQLRSFPHDWVGKNGVLNNLSLGQQIANQSMVFGPQPGLDKFIRPIASYFIPYLMVYRVDGALYYTPILWMAPILLLAIALGGPLMTYPFDRLEMKAAWEGRKQRKKMAKERSLHLG